MRCRECGAPPKRVELLHGVDTARSARAVRTVRLIYVRATYFPGVIARVNYCFRIRQRNEERRYIGETENLARRFGNYGNPRATQETNIRINARLLEALHAGDEIPA